MKKRINIFVYAVSILLYHDSIQSIVEIDEPDNIENTTKHTAQDHDDEIEQIIQRQKQEESLKQREAKKTQNNQDVQDTKQPTTNDHIAIMLHDESEQIKFKNLYNRLSAEEKLSLKALKLSKGDYSSTLDFQDLRHFSDEDLMIMDKLISLPETNRPSNVFVALKHMNAGEKAWNSMQKDDFNGAVKINYPAALRIPDAIITAMNKSDDEFWNLIKDDEALKKTIEKNDVTFDYKTFKLLEFNSYFRSTYIRKKINSPLHVEMYSKAYEKTICQMQWFLYKQSILEGKAFTSGMISLHDPENHIFKLMDRYMELVSPKFKFLGTIRSIIRTKAYARISSHYGGQTDIGGINFGIDMDKNNPDLALPGNKSHILFGMRTNSMMFIKWENYGTTLNPIEGDYSSIQHMAGYFKKHGKEDNPLLESREKTPKEIEEKFKELYAQDLTEAEEKLIKAHGITSMIDILELHEPNKATEFKEYLVKTFGYKEETLPYRKGSEVILNPKNFTPSPTKPI